MSRLSAWGVVGFPEVKPGDQLADMIVEACRNEPNGPLLDRDVLVVTQKVVSKAEGRLVAVNPDDPLSHKALVEKEAVRIVRRRGDLIITETEHGFVCANSGVDQSSSGAHGRAVLLPVDPDASARRIRAGLRAAGVDAAVIVSDTFGRAWREGQTDIAIGVAGIQPILSYIGQVDPHGHEFRVQAICVADELAGAAELVKGNLSRVPVAVIRGHGWEPDDEASMAPVLRDQSRDLFR